MQAACSKRARGDAGRHGYREYVLTDKGLSLWPVVRDLLSWGDE